MKGRLNDPLTCHETAVEEQRKRSPTNVNDCPTVAPQVWAKNGEVE